MSFDGRVEVLAYEVNRLEKENRELVYRVDLLIKEVSRMKNELLAFQFQTDSTVYDE